MRDFNFNDTPRTIEANNVGLTPSAQDVPLNVRSDESLREETSLRPFHVEVEKDPANNTAKIVGGIVVGLLILGGGIYAYKSSSAPVQGQQQLALKTPTSNHAATNQAATASPVAPTPDTSATPAPAETITPSPNRSSRTLKAADNADSSTATAANTATPPAATTDEAVNAPMTLTPQTAPPAEQPAPAGQTAMQQPVTAPDVSGQTVQPAPEVANNAAVDTAQTAPQPATVQPQLTAPADQPAQTDQPAQPVVQPQLNPAQ